MNQLRGKASNRGKVCTLKQTPEPWFEWGKCSRPSILRPNHGVPISRSAKDPTQCHKSLHRSHFCQRYGDHRGSNPGEQTSVYQRGRTTIQQAELKRYTRSLPCCLKSETKIDDGCWVDISLLTDQSRALNVAMSRHDSLPQGLPCAQSGSQTSAQADSPDCPP